MSDWARQRAQAQFLGNIPDYARIQRLRKYRGNSSIGDAIDAHDVETLRSELVEPASFGEFITTAYDNPEGWAIRVNPVTGDKEMMVAGSKSVGDWALNALDTVYYGTDKMLDAILEDTILVASDGQIRWNPHMNVFGRFDRVRAQYTKKLEAIADAHEVDIIYGHSRGGAIAADMKVNARKVGIDAAMLIANNTSALNLNEGGTARGTFDAFIGLTGQENLHLDLGHHMHQIWN